MTHMISVDIGNDTVKVISGDLYHRFVIPNVLATEKIERRIIEEEQEPLEALHVNISSDALQEKSLTCVIGRLATKYPNPQEVTSNTNKSQASQSLALLLTSIAYDATQNIPNQANIAVHYNLAVGLPLREVKRGHKQEFIHRIKEYVHEVTFLDTPKLKGRKVTITFDDVLCYAEGHAAYVDLTSTDDGRLQNAFIKDSTVLIHDIGGLTSDAAIIGPKGKLNNLASDSLKEGVGPYLDEIIFQVDQEFGIKIRSRQELVQILTAERSKRYLVGHQRITIKPVVDEVLMILAEKEYRFLSRLLQQNPDIEFVYIIGGGSIILQPYLETLNSDQYNLRFLYHQDDSIWMNAKSYFKLLRMHLTKVRD